MINIILKEGDREMETIILILFITCIVSLGVCIFTDMCPTIFTTELYIQSIEVKRGLFPWSPGKRYCYSCGLKYNIAADFQASIIAPGWYNCEIRYDPIRGYKIIYAYPSKGKIYIKDTTNI